MKRILPLIAALLIAVVGLTARGADDQKDGSEDAPVDPRACVTCHDRLGVSGHFPPEAKGCIACHALVDESLLESGADAAILEGDFTHLELIQPGETLCQDCHEMPEVATPHAPTAEGACMDCHDPHDRSKDEGHLHSDREADVCETCHDPVDKERFLHTEVMLGGCSGCHDPHGSDQPLLLRGERGVDACRECHEDQFTEDAHDHWPAYSGRCETCHDPHGSDYDYSLILEPRQVCYQCHPAKEHKFQIHSAVKLGRCSTCHDPHGSENEFKLRADPVASVCFQCHYDDVNGRAVVHAPVGEGNCLMCHDPHQTDFPKNLRTSVNVTCGMCHPDKYRPDVATPHPAVISYGCTVCHDPHASDNDFRLRKPIIELCTTCHVGYDDGYHVVQRPAGGGHPIGGKDDPLREGRELVCSSCHDPHGTENPRMWYRAYERLALCVECHRGELAPLTGIGGSTFEESSQERREKELEPPPEE